MPSILGSIRNGFLKFFGDLKVFPYPLFLLYDPGSYQVKGDDIRRLIGTLEHGDIMMVMINVVYVVDLMIQNL